MDKNKLREIAVSAVEIVNPYREVWPMHTVLTIGQSERGQFYIYGLSKEKIVEIIYQELLEWDVKTQNIDWDELYNQQYNR